MLSLVALLLSLAPQSGELDLLENVNVEVRLRAVEITGIRKSPLAVGRLIGRLEDPVETAPLKAAALKSLESITGRSEKDAAAWKKWWDAEGKTLYPLTAFNPEELMKQIAQNDDKNLLRITKAQSEVRSVAITLAVAILLFIIMMFFFVGHVSSKIKGWRELVARAEIYIKHGQELTERTDKIAAEIESRKAELAAYVEKVRKEQEEEISRRGDELGSRLEHELRMELQNLRQKAERELDQTVTDLKTQIETTARRAASELRDRLAK